MTEAVGDLATHSLHRAVGMLMRAVPSRVTTVAEISIAGISSPSVAVDSPGTSTVGVNFAATFTVAVDTALGSELAFTRRMGTQRRCAIQRVSMTSTVYGDSIQVVR